GGGDVLDAADSPVALAGAGEDLDTVALPVGEGAHTVELGLDVRREGDVAAEALLEPVREHGRTCSSTAAYGVRWYLWSRFFCHMLLASRRACSSAVVSLLRPTFFGVARL